MGYYTSFELKYYKPETHEDISEEEESAILKYMEETGDYFQEFENGYMYGKWYEYNNDMIEMSKHFPEVVFKLYGVGEEQPDMWRTYYLNGEVFHTVATITYEECSW